MTTTPPGPDRDLRDAHLLDDPPRTPNPPDRARLGRRTPRRLGLVAPVALVIAVLARVVVLLHPEDVLLLVETRTAGGTGSPCPG